MRMITVGSYAKLQPHIKEAWLKALRSGKYRQGTERLRTENGFCCLGVLCDIGEKKAWEHSNPKLNAPPEWIYVYGDERHVGDLDPDHLAVAHVQPSKLMKVMGLDRMAHVQLVEMNDNGMSFAQIADWIEDNL